MLFCLGALSCTRDFGDINRDPYGVTPEEMSRLPQGGTQLIALQKLVIPEQENSYQMCFDLGITGYAGYATQIPNFRNDYPVYSPRTDWVNYIYNDTYPKIYAAYFELNRLAKGDYNQLYFAWGSLLRASITSWFTDIFGPMPYTKMAEAQLSVEYDSQEVLYKAMCEDIKKAITTLSKVDPSNRQYAAFDLVYGGDMSKWTRYGSSLLLRLAIRMAKKMPNEAKEYAEFAIQQGVIDSKANNAQMESVDNPVFKVSTTWQNSGVNAEITEYMNAFSDPRRDVYFTPVTSRTAGRQFFGIRNGTTTVNYVMSDYSLPKVQQNSPIVWMSAAEVAFLKAEGALNGWNVGGTAEELYRKGVELSFDQWGASLGNYLSNSFQRGALVDEKATGFNVAFNSPVTVNWNDAGGDKEKQLARIITQKWIAMFPYGSQEAWAEWRRTGYPNMMPAAVNNSGGAVASITRAASGRDLGGMQRLPYSTTEVNNNVNNIRQAISFLGGADNGGTQLWWAK